MISQSEIIFATPQRNRKTLKSLKNVIVHVFTSKVRMFLSKLQENEVSSAHKGSMTVGVLTHLQEKKAPQGRET